MKYVPKDVDDSVNVSTGNNTKTILSIAISLMLGVCAIVAIIFISVEYLVSFVPVSMERSLHQKFISKRTQTTQTKALESLVQSLVKGSNLESFPFSFSVKKSKQKNAYIMPGGHIVIFTGLLKELKSENELAFILAHEIGHFYKRHHLKSFGKNLALMFVGSMVSNSIDFSFEEVSKTASLATLSFSRRDETEADVFALRLLANHYGHVAGHDGLFKIFYKEEGRSGKMLQFFNSHPASQTRVEHLKKIIKDRGYQANGDQKDITAYL